MLSTKPVFEDTREDRLTNIYSLPSKYNSVDKVTEVRIKDLLYFLKHLATKRFEDSELTEQNLLYLVDHTKPGRVYIIKEALVASLPNLNIFTKLVEREFIPYGDYTLIE